MTNLIESEGICLEKRIDLVKKWFLYSGIQDNNRDSNTFGGFNAWYDIYEKNFSFVYSEIVGYGISTLTFLHHAFPDEDKFIERAFNAVNWLSKAKYKKGGFLCRFYREKDTFNNKVCAFDAGMILNGLTNLYDISNDKYIFEMSKSIGYWLIDTMQKEDGSFYVRYLTDKNKFVDNENKWSAQSGSFHAKLSIGLLHLYDQTKNTKFKESVISLCDYALTKQEETGRFITNHFDNSTFVHPHCYTLEGLIAAGYYLKDNRYITAVRKGLSWIFENQLPSGAFPFKFLNNKFLNSESPDFTSQIIRLYILMKKLKLHGELIVDNKKIEKAIENILAYQSHDVSREANGGFFSGAAWFNGVKNDFTLRHVNSWVSMFVMQTLIYYNSMQNNFKSELFTPFYLI